MTTVKKRHELPFWESKIGYKVYVKTSDENAFQTSSEENSELHKKDVEYKSDRSKVVYSQKHQPYNLCYSVFRTKHAAESAMHYLTQKVKKKRYVVLPVEYWGWITEGYKQFMVSPVKAPRYFRVDVAEKIMLGQ